MQILDKDGSDWVANTLDYYRMSPISMLERLGNGTVCFKNVNNYLNTNIYSLLRDFWW
jgi:hypothetical protein